MMEALAPGFERAELESLEEVAVGSRLDRSTPTRSSARASRRRPRASRAAARSTSRSPRRRVAVFMREVADVHRELYAENADLYGANVAAKIETCLAVTDGEYEAGLRAQRARTASRSAELFEGLDLVVTPTLPLVAPPTGQDERELRGAADPV